MSHLIFHWICINGVFVARKYLADRLDNLGIEVNNTGTVGILLITHAHPDEAFLVHHMRGINQD
jgi:hypothetical protein